MANDINKEDPHYKGEYGSIYEVNRKFPTGGVAGDFVVIEGWAHYWNADRGTWCVNAERDSYWDELITNIIEKFKLVRGATYMGVASLDAVPAKAIGAKMYYFATVAGKYKNFGNLVVPQGINVLYSENGSSWVNTTLLEVAQELGVSTNKVVSQKTLNDALNLKADKSSVNEALAKKADKEEMNRLLGTKANTDYVDTKFTEEKERVDGELEKKLDKQSVVQESGEAEDKVMSQKAVSAKLSDLDDVAHQLEVSDIFFLKHYSYNYPHGIFTKNNSYDLIICKIEEGVLEVAFNTNARRHALYSDNPYNDQSSKYQVFDSGYNANDVITIPQTVKYVVFMVESNNNNSYYELSIKKNLYCGLSKNTFKKHLEEVSNIDHYDYRQDIIKGMWFRSVNASFYFKDAKGIVFVKIKNGSKFIRMFLKKAFEVHFFSDIPLYNDGKSNYISTYNSYDSGAEIPTNAKYCIFCFELNDVASMKEPLIIQQINEETNVDIMASSSVFEKYIDLTITEAAIQGAFNGGVYPEGVISKLRACSLYKIDDENTLLAFCLETAKAICIASISNNGDVSQSFITWSSHGVGYAYPSLVRDKDGKLHLFFAAYMLDYTSSMTKHYISKDNGNTWSFANDIEYKLESDGYTRHFMCSSYQALLAKSGKLIVPVYYINSTVPASAAGILIYDTDTDSYMFHVFADQSDSVNEGSVAEIENNVFILSLRTQRNICRIAYLIDFNEESPYFKPYFDFSKNIVSKKNGEMIEYHNNLLALTKITKGNSNSANERYDPSLFISCDNGKTFVEKIKIFEGQTVGESTVISDGNGYILCAAMHFDGYRLVKVKRVF